MTRKILIIAFMLIAFVFIHLALITNITSAGYRLDERESLLNGLKSENTDLAARSAVLRSPEKIDSYARNSLKMVKPERIEYLLLSGEAD